MSEGESAGSERDNFDDLMIVDPMEQILPSILISDALFMRSADFVGRTFESDFNDALTCADEVITTTIKSFEKEVRRRELERRIVPFSIASSLFFANSFLEMGLSACDENTNDTLIPSIEDDEPGRVKQDMWMRTVVNVESQLLKEDTVTHQLMDSDRESHTSRSSTTSRLGQWKKNQQRSSVNKSAADEPIHEAAIISMEKPVESDEFEDRVRVMKQLELKRKHEIEEQENQAILEQKRMQMNHRVDSKQKYTYDYDGKILTMKGIKSEKLPPTNYSVQFQSRDDVIRAKGSGGGGSGAATATATINNLNNMKDLQKQSGGKDQSNNQSLANIGGSTDQEYTQQSIRQIGGVAGGQDSKQKYSVPFEYESFVPSKGVKIVYESKFKEGSHSNGQPPITDAEQLEWQLKQHKENEPLHITKSDYRKLTEKGNLSRNVFSTANQPGSLAGGGAAAAAAANPSMLNADATHTHGATSIIRQDAGLTISLEHSPRKSKDILTRASRFIPKIDFISQRQKINIANPELVATLNHSATQPSLFQQQVEEQISKNLKLPKLPVGAAAAISGNDRNKSIPALLQASPTDSFNQGIMDDKNWGKQKAGMFMPPLPLKSLVKPSSLHDYKMSLNSLDKLPRDRDRMMTMRKTQQNFASGFSTPTQTQHQLLSARLTASTKMFSHREQLNLNNASTHLAATGNLDVAKSKKK